MTFITVSGRTRIPVDFIVIGLMSNFQQMTKHPLTGEMKLANWLDLGQRFYVVQFPDGQRFCETEIESIGGESSQGETAVEDWDGPEEPR